jgi:cytoskeletal protein CcmA (bactofilin family)
MLGNKTTTTVGTTHNSITIGTFIKGDIKAEEDFRIDGKIEGNIECSGKVIIGPQAEITGNINCNNADLMGKIKGNITVNETISLKSQVVFNGEILAKYVDIEAGAIFNGTCTMK